MSEEKKDPKEGEEKQPSGTGQPDNKDTDEKVEISKSELEKLRKKSTDFDGLADRLKKKDRAGRVLPGAEPVKKEKEEEDDDDELKEEFVTKKDFQKTIEKSAIKEASKDQEVDDNWDSIMEFYVPRHGKDTIESIISDIEIAHKTWKAQQPVPSKEPEKKEDEDKKSTSDLAKDAGLGKGKDKQPKPVKKSILPKKEKMQDWYGK